MRLFEVMSASLDEQEMGDYISTSGELPNIDNFPDTKALMGFDSALLLFAINRIKHHGDCSRIW